LSSVNVYFHNHCFDGSVSAALFTALHRGARPAAAGAPPTKYHYRGLSHTANGLFERADFDAPDNAIVDFKYSRDPRVTWWFDHHQSAFLTPADAEHFKRENSPQKFFDPNYGSCSKLIADVGRERFGLDTAPIEDLIHWADLIDQARFPSAKAAVELKEPALQLMLAIEGSTDSEFLPRLIPDFLAFPLGDLVQREYVQRELQPLLARHWKSLELIHQRLECVDGVIYFDVSDLDLEGYNKFIPYYFCPDAVYCVGVSRGAQRMKVSIGSNPWMEIPHLVNLAQVCERYGGGGHARVGAVSFAREDLERARAVANEVVAELRRAPKP